MWVWVHEDVPPDPDAIGAFAARERVSEAFVSVPWTGPSELTRRVVAALRARDVGVAALGGDPSWAENRDALAWARRAEGSGLFTGIHLDIEPWSRPDWHGRERELLAGVARATRDVASASALPVEIDLAPWLAELHPQEFAACAGAAAAVTLMAYRDRADDILAVSAAARSLLDAARRPARIGVETGPVRHPAPGARETFADDGRAVLERELASVVARLDPRVGFAGIAVHDDAGWAALPA